MRHVTNTIDQNKQELASRNFLLVRTRCLSSSRRFIISTNHHQKIYNWSTMLPTPATEDSNVAPPLVSTTRSKNTEHSLRPTTQKTTQLTSKLLNESETTTLFRTDCGHIRATTAAVRSRDILQTRRERTSCKQNSHVHTGSGSFRSPWSAERLGFFTAVIQGCSRCRSAARVATTSAGVFPCGGGHWMCRRLLRRV